MAAPLQPVQQILGATILEAATGRVIPPWTASQCPLRLSLVIPTYNERESLPQLVDQLDALLAPRLPGDYEIIVVDDNSSDGTGDLALALAQRYPALKLLRRRERGLATAVVCGWQCAQGQYLAVMDGDFQHPPKLLLALVAQLERGASLAVASRHGAGDLQSFRQGWGWRRSLSQGAQCLGKLLLPELFNRVSDPLSGCFAVERGAIAGRVLQPVGYKILLEVLAKGQIDSIAEVGYCFGERRSGQSKVTAQQAWQYLRHLLRLRWFLLRDRLQPIGRRS
jgi:dolichol-phosphate mannosyltransferase